MALVFYNTRLARASLVSLPSDLFVYIPGYTMQRLSTAYAAGGFNGLFQALEYSFGVRPDHWIMVGKQELSALVDTLGGIEVALLAPMPVGCGGQKTGTQLMNGERALCYVIFRTGYDEVERNLRQQQVMRVLFLRLVENGGLAQLPELYDLFGRRVETDLTLRDLQEEIPLALKLGDPGRVNYYQVGWDAVTPWEIPGKANSWVLLPNLQRVRGLLVEAVQAANQPLPLTERVATLEFELTVSPTPTITPLPTATPSLIPTRVLSPTITLTPTITWTPTTTPTGPTPTPTVTGTPTPSPTGPVE
jgi:LCP family protein required for cell wall assembly